MSVYTDKRTGRLFVQFDYLKQTHKQYLPIGISRRDAAKVETKMRSDLFFKANGMAPIDETLFEDFALETYLPHVKKKNPASFNHADHICTEALPFFKGKFLRSITTDDIEEFKTYRECLPIKHGRPRLPATVHRELCTISGLFKLAVKKKKLENNPCTNVEWQRISNVMEKVLEREDEAAFFAAFDQAQGQTARDVCIVVLNTGLSQSDVLGLTDFQVGKQTLRFVRGKTQRYAEIPVNDAAWAVIAPRRGKGLLFPSEKDGGRLKSVRSAVAGACRRAEIDPITIKDLRRTFGSRLEEDGVDVLTIARLLMHGDLRSVMRYARSNRALRNAVDGMQNTANSTPGLLRQKLRIAK